LRPECRHNRFSISCAFPTPETDRELIDGDGLIPHHLLKVAASANMSSLQPRRPQIISV